MSSTIALISSAVFDKLLYPLNLVSNGTEAVSTFYETVYSMQLVILRQNLAYISICLYLLWYIKAYLSKTDLIAKEGSLMHKMLDKFAVVHTGYRPTIWCFPSTLNTIMFSFIQRCIKHDYTREILKTDDGGLIAIDWANLDAPKKVILIVFPGLTGCSKDNYVTHLVDKAIKSGCTAVVMNYRGIEVELTTPRTYCATDHSDLHMVINHVHNKYKEHKILAVGVSLGGIKLGGYLAKQYDDSLISYALIVSAPMNTIYSCEELEKTHHFFTFNRHLSRSLGRYFSKYKHLFETDQKYDCEAIARCSSLREFDTKFVCKQFGYESLLDYYKDACLDSKIQNIKIPTIFLNAGDDMFSPSRAFPIEKLQQNPYTAMVWTKYGGHISFCEGILPTGCNYVCRLLKEYLDYVLNESQELEKLLESERNTLKMSSSLSDLSEIDEQPNLKFTLE